VNCFQLKQAIVWLMVKLSALWNGFESRQLSEFPLQRHQHFRQSAASGSFCCFIVLSFYQAETPFCLSAGAFFLSSSKPAGSSPFAKN
jgi:hypothetical protein